MSGLPRLFLDIFLDAKLGGAFGVAKLPRLLGRNLLHGVRASAIPAGELSRYFHARAS
jgi:hypothetical protein